MNLSQCSNLIAIRLGFNKLNLEKLILHYKNLTGILPSSIGNFSSLTTISVVVNSVIGTIPENFYGLSKLRDFSIAINQIFRIVLLSL